MAAYKLPITDGLTASQVVITDANKKLASQSGLTDSKAVITSVSLSLIAGVAENSDYVIYVNNSDLAANWIGCLFTTTNAVSVFGVILPFTYASGTVTVSIRATSSSLPTGGDLGSGTFTGTAGGYVSGMTFIGFSSPISLSASTTYAIILRVGTNVRLRWGGLYGSPYTYVYSSDSGSSWTLSGDKRLRYSLVCGSFTTAQSTLAFTKGVLTGIT